MNSFTVEIVTPERLVFQGEAVSLVAPAAHGSLEVLSGHAPLTAALQAGKILIRDQSGNVRTFENAGGGFLSVERNVVILAVGKVVPDH